MNSQQSIHKFTQLFFRKYPLTTWFYIILFKCQSNTTIFGKIFYIFQAEFHYQMIIWLEVSRNFISSYLQSFLKLWLIKIYLIRIGLMLRFCNIGLLCCVLPCDLLSYQGIILLIALHFSRRLLK